MALAAQSTSAGEISGVVTASGLAVRGALVTLGAPGRGEGETATTDAAGGFRFPFVLPGSYEIRVEALGYRPLVARPLTVGSGESRNLSLSLGTARPPVLEVDTLLLAASASSRQQLGGTRFDGRTLNALPHRERDLAAVVAMSSLFDEELGAQGLPGGMTLFVADGVRLYGAPDPRTGRDGTPSDLFPNASVTSVGALHDPAHIGWAGSAGGYVSLSTNADAGSLAARGAYSSDALWSSTDLDGATPSLTSLEGALTGSTAVGVNGSLSASMSVLRHQTPLAPGLSESLAPTLDGFDPDLLGDLTTPGTESFDRYAGSVRLDTRSGSAGRLFIRGSGAFVERTIDGGAPLSLATGRRTPESSTYFAVAGGWLGEQSSSTTIQLRGGVSGAFRSFDGPDPGVPVAMMSGPGALLGDFGGFTGESSRTDVVLAPSVRHRSAVGTIDIGVDARISKHEMSEASAGPGLLIYHDGAALSVGRGYGQTVSAPTSSFGSQEFGASAQFESELRQGVRLVAGVRYDLERVSLDDFEGNGPWLDASGLMSTDFPDSYHQLGAVAALEWEPSSDGSTRLFTIGSVRYGDLDPLALARVTAQDGDATSTVYAGSELDWPQPTFPGNAPTDPTTTVFGPDTRPPRTTKVDVGITQRLGDALVAHLQGSLRRTDFLLRTRNLNVAVAPRALDPNGRAMYGTLTKDGSLVVATSTDGRRFPGFAEAWALDPDGWSESKALTVVLEYGTGPVDLFGSYTYSETIDNWVGARDARRGTALRPGLPDTGDDSAPWSEGVSDFDVPHRLSVGMTSRIGPVSVSSVYRFMSGAPFTAGYRDGVDANGDGSPLNDVPFVPSVSELGPLGDAWPCLEAQAGGFAIRNACRGPERHLVNARLQIRLGELGGRAASLTVDGLDLIESDQGVVDDALLLVDPDTDITTSMDGTTVTIPTTPNPAFGELLYPRTRGRMLRVGIQIGM